MKKLLAICVLALASLSLTPGTSSAFGGTFGYFTQTCHWPFNYLACCGCNKCCTTVCCKPYNAFSPSCCGTISFNGCCPTGGPQDGAGFAPGGYGNLPLAGPCSDGGTLGMMPWMPYEGQPPVAPVQGVNTSRQVQTLAPYYGPMQVNYSYPTYYAPRTNATQPMAVPYYWNSNGR